MKGHGDPNGFVVFQGISKRYKDLLALDNVSFEIRKGDIFGYIGPNGAGKTTTIKILVGLLRGFQGSVYVDGRPLNGSRVEVQKELGYLPQGVAFQEWRTVNHALTTLGRLSGLDKNALEHRIKEVLNLVGLSDARHKKIIYLSGGMVQKLGVAQAMLHNPSLLILDEPLSGLDPASRFQVKNIVRGLARSGTTVLFSSHILSDVQDIATRIGILNRGRMIRVGTVDELKSQFSVTNDLHVELSHDSGRWGELESLSGVATTKQPSPNQLLISLHTDVDMDETIHSVLQGLIDSGCRIRSLYPLSPNLEQVYLKLVGGGEGQ